MENGESLVQPAQVDSGKNILPSEAVPVQEALAREGLWLGLRALTGLSRTDFAALHGYDPLLRHHAPIADLQARGLLAVEGDWLRLTRRGALFADEVGAVFL